MARGYTDYTMIEDFKEQLRPTDFEQFLDWCQKTAEILKEEEDEPPVRRPRTGSEALREETRLRELQNQEYMLA